MRFQFCLPAMGDGCPGHCHIKSVFTPDWCDYPADVCNTKTSLYRSQVFDRNIVLLAVSGRVNISRFWFFVKIHFSNFPSRPLPSLSPAIEIYEPVFTITHILNIVKKTKTNDLKQTLARINILLQIFVYLCLIIDEYLLLSANMINRSFQFYKLFIFFNNYLQSFFVFFTIPNRYWELQKHHPQLPAPRKTHSSAWKNRLFFKNRLDRSQNGCILELS